ncbi:unnamed protein product, partial [Cylindrotheca closterium]
MPLRLHWAILIVLAFSVSISEGSSSAQLKSFVSKTGSNVVIGVDGGTESIRACCFDAETGDVVGKSCASAYKTYHPQPGWAEQMPQDWWENLGEAVRGAVASI